MAENLLMLVPLVYAFFAAQTRQNFLIRTIGPIPQETEAYEKLMLLAIIMPSLSILAVPIQMALIYGFNKAGHPWKIFFEQF